MGLDSFFAHHRILGDATRAGVKALGLELLAKRPGNVLTCCKVPEGIDGGKLVKTMQGKYMAYIAGGQDPNKGKFFRIAHLGYMGGFDIITALSALEMTLMDLGYKFEAGRRHQGRPGRPQGELAMTKILIADGMDKEALEQLKAVPGFEVTVKKGMSEADLVQTSPASTPSSSGAPPRSPAPSSRPGRTSRSSSGPASASTTSTAARPRRKASSSPTRPRRRPSPWPSTPSA